MARQRGISRSALVREAIEAYLENGAAGGLSVYDLVSDLIGSVQGPGDLSTNPSYMEGYGE